MSAPTQGEREALPTLYREIVTAWDESGCYLAWWSATPSGAKGQGDTREAAVTDLISATATWLAALSAPQEESGADNHHNALACRYCTDDEAFASEARRRGWVLAPQVAQPGGLGIVRDAYVEGFRDAAHDGKPSNEADAWWTISEARSRFYRQRSETHADSDFRASALRRVVAETGDLMDRLYAAGGLATGALCIEASQALEGLLLLVQDGEAEIASRRAAPPVAGSREMEEAYGILLADAITLLHSMAWTDANGPRLNCRWCHTSADAPDHAGICPIAIVGNRIAEGRAALRESRAEGAIARLRAPAPGTGTEEAP